MPSQQWSPLPFPVSIKEPPKPVEVAHDSWPALVSTKQRAVESSRLPINWYRLDLFQRQFIKPYETYTPWCNHVTWEWHALPHITLKLKPATPETRESKDAAALIPESLGNDICLLPHGTWNLSTPKVPTWPSEEIATSCNWIFQKVYVHAVKRQI